MKLKFEPVTEKNRAQALRLHGAPGQEGLVEPVEQCLAEAEQWKGWRPVLILDGERPVGFAMYGKFPLESFPFGRVWLDRLLIAGEHQGRGYGKAALAGLIQRLREEYRCKKIYLSIVEGNWAAAELYQEREIPTGNRSWCTSVPENRKRNGPYHVVWPIFSQTVRHRGWR